MFHVYILQSLKDKRTYVGYTKNIKDRLLRHNSGRVPATKHRQPLKLLFYEAFETARQAKDREKWWKGGSGRRQLAQYFKTH